eukprot:SAG11_NODE_2330_length_3509_cov_3.113196_2_plen_555_part_00
MGFRPSLGCESVNSLTNLPMWTNVETGELISEDPCTPETVEAWLENLIRVAPAADDTLPDGWVRHFDDTTQREYYVNANLHATQWERPEAGAAIELKRFRAMDSSLFRLHCSALFAQIDTNGDGKLTVGEIRAGLDAIRGVDGLKMKAKRICKSANTDDDESLDMDEFCAFLHKYAAMETDVVSTDRSLTTDAIFDDIDRNDGGTIDFAEFEMWWLEQCNADGVVDDSDLELLETARRWFAVSGNGEADRESFQSILTVLATAAWAGGVDPATNRPVWTNKETGDTRVNDPCTPATVEAWLERVTFRSTGDRSQSKWKRAKSMRHVGAFSTPRSVVDAAPSAGGEAIDASGTTLKWKNARAMRHVGAFGGMQNPLAGVTQPGPESAVVANTSKWKKAKALRAGALGSGSESTSVAVTRQKSTNALAAQCEAASRPRSVTTMFDEIDHDHNGHITFAELRNWWVGKCIANGFKKEEAETVVQRAKSMFEQLDFDGTGRCDCDDIQAIIESMVASRWVEGTDSEGQKFYMDRETKQTQYAEPGKKKADQWLHKHVG